MILADLPIFDVPLTGSESKLLYLPVPWEATVSYGHGTAKGPAAILRASYQLDLFDRQIDRPYLAGFEMLSENPELHQWNQEARLMVHRVLENRDREAVARVNQLSVQLNRFVYSEVRSYRKAGKYLGLIGGEHSVSFGGIQAIAEEHSSLGVLQFDAHMDARRAYQDFEWSHASVMYNVLERIPQVTKLVQVGIRDFCEEELQYLNGQKDRVRIFYDYECARRKFEGVFWKTITEEIISELPQDVWISFDIDGLDPKFCPSTGTPVPGGLDFNEAVYVLEKLVQSGRKIIGFDLVEVAPGKSSEWDANVGMRLLYKLSAWFMASQGLVTRLS